MKLFFTDNLSFLSIKLNTILSEKVDRTENPLDLFRECYANNSDFEKIKKIADDLAFSERFTKKQKENFSSLLNYIVKNIQPSNSETNLECIIGIVSRPHISSLIRIFYEAFINNLFLENK